MLASATSVAASAAASAASAAARTLTVVTWNVAAVNNNPFEYWLTIPSHPSYEKLMIDVETFLEDPGDGDVPVHKVFTDGMYDRLERRMIETAGWDETVPTVRSMWMEDFRKRRIVSEFVRDESLGSKRLASMPDRVTNTINVAGEGEKPVCRPTVINMYDGDLSTVDKWYDAWETFMFDTELDILAGSDSKTTTTTIPYKMLKPIKRSKYPDVTEEEERASLPLQTLCGAIFDAVLVHMMNAVSAPDVWQPLKRTIAEALVRDKVPNTLGILEKQYAKEADVITLQEASLALIERARGGPLGKAFHVWTPAGADPARDQNSAVLLRKSTFPGEGDEITDAVESRLGKDAPVARGDVLAVRASDSRGVPHVVASFHGDTNGLATAPVLDALVDAVKSCDGKESNGRIIFGLDANTYEFAKPKKQADVTEFGKQYSSRGLTSCWEGDGSGLRPSEMRTTYNARTYLQPQLNKACKSSLLKGAAAGGVGSKADINPKDFILFGSGEYEVQRVWKDNTGEGTYEEGAAFPTLTFPSDHGIVAAVLRDVGKVRGEDVAAESCSA